VRRRVLLGAVGLLMIVAVPVADACPLCLGGVLFAPEQQLYVAERACSPRQWPMGRGWRVLEVVKGHAVAGQVISEPVDRGDVAADARRKPCSPAPRTWRAGPAWARSASEYPAGCGSWPPPARGRAV